MVFEEYEVNEDMSWWGKINCNCNLNFNLKSGRKIQTIRNIFPNL